MGKIKQLIIELEDKDGLDYDLNDDVVLENLWQLQKGMRVVAKAINDLNDE